MNREDIRDPRQPAPKAAKNNKGEVLSPFGEAPERMILYHAGSYMSHTAMRANRPKLASADTAGGICPDEETVA